MLAIPLAILMGLVMYWMFGAIGVFILIFFTLAMIYICVDSDKKEKQARQKAASDLKNFIQVNVSKIVNWQKLPQDVSYWHWQTRNGEKTTIFFDYAFPYFAVLTQEKIHLIPLSAIVSVQIEAEYSTISTTTRKGTVKRAVVGGAIAGSTGAIIGGTTGDTVTQSNQILNIAWVKVHTTDLRHHTMMIPTDSMTIANNIEGIILALKTKNQNLPFNLQS